MPSATLLVAWMSCASMVRAQGGFHWAEAMRDPTVPVDSVAALFDAAWPEGQAERGKGLKPFQRWLAFAKPRCGPDGTRPLNGLVLRALEAAEEDRLEELAQRSVTDPSWTYAGPTGPTGLGGSGRLNRLVDRPGVPEEWWACAPAGGVWRTTDEGLSWTAMGNGQLESIGVTDIAFHPTDPDRLWIATGDGDFGDTRSIGIWSSVDGGHQWEATGLDWAPYMGRTLTRILVHPDHPDTLWAASSLGIYRSVDGGDQWARTLTGNMASLEFDPSDPTHLLAGAFGNMVAESHDAGATWSTSFINGESYGLSRIALAFSPSEPQTVYALAGKISDQGFAGIWKSADGGNSWTAQMTEGQGPNLLGWTVQGSDVGGQAWYDLTLAVHPQDPDRLFVGGVNLWESGDAGLSWNCAAHWYSGGDLPYLHADQHGIHFLPDGTLLVGNDGGAFRFDPDAGTALDRSAGLAIAQTYRVDADPLAMDRFIAGTQDNGTFLKHDGQWEHVLGGDGFDCAFHSELPDVVYASLYYGQLFRSDDGGNAFQQIAGNAGADQDAAGAWLTPWAVSAFNPDWIYAAKDRVYRSTDRGETWSALGSIPGGDCTAMALAANDVGRLYVAKEATLYRATNGQDFSELDVPNGFSHIADIEVNPADAEEVWIALSNYNNNTKVLHSTDGGENWTSLSDGLPPAPVNTLAVDAADTGDLFAGTDVGIYHRAAGASDWVRMSDGLPNVVVTDLVLHAPSGRLVAATYGRGLYTLDLPDPPSLDAALGRLRSPRGAHCDSVVHPVVPVHNLGTDIIHQLQLEYGHFGGASGDTLWNGELLPGDSIHLALNPIAAPAGWADFTVLLTEVDGQPDERSANNTRSERSLRMSDAVDIVVSFTTDCFASQHGWVLRDPLGRVLHRSGWLPPSATSVDTLCLPASTCLEFEVHQDQLSGYESLMVDCLAPLAFSLREVGSDAAFLSAPESGVVDTYTFCTDALNVGGCTDPYADNYDADAAFDDGTCEPVCYPLTISMDAGCAPEEAGWSLNPDGLGIAPGGVQAGTAEWNLCLEEGCRDFVLVDLAADGWDSGCGPTHLTLLVGTDTLYHADNPVFSSAIPIELCLPPTHLIGCMEPQACNFNPEADGPGACDYSCYGCTSTTACNYEPEATRNDATCIEASGCTHPAACNFDLFALCDDGGCVFPDDGLDCDGNCLSGDVDGDGICDGDEFAGCTHVDACNFTPGATEDDGSCFFPVEAWPDTDGDGFGDASDGAAQPFCGVPPPGWVTIPGDCNDASANFYPGAPFAPLGGDVNCDGFVSASELAPCASDLNQDGLTAIDDLLGLLSEFGCQFDCQQDVDGNGTVTSADLLILLAGFGTECTQ